MATVVIMPRQGQSVESCIITEWKKNKGDKVAVGDILFTYETDKSSFEEAANVEGTLLEILAEEGDDVPVLQPVCVIGEPGEDISALVADAQAPEAEKSEEAEKAAPAQDAAAAEAPAAESMPAAKSVDVSSLKISPRARRLAEKTDADLSRVVPTGPNGRVIERDINRLLDLGLTKSASAEPAELPVPAAAQPVASAAAQVEYRDVKLTSVRRTIAKAMHASLSSMAQLTLNASFDATKLLEMRAALKERAEKLGLPNITLNDMILFAVSRTILAHPDLNAHYLEEEGVIRQFTGVNLGIAVDTERGLLVPTLFGADKLTLAELSAKAKELIAAAQRGSVAPDLLRGASFTVTNLGSLGVESFTPVINPPQTGILGVCNITRRVKEVDGKDVFYPAMGLSLTFDHRALDGAPAARFLRDLSVNLENFDLLLAR
ncbi:MAG: dihydrolipoamide acetyltransferase family protein [Eubacteriales bacterium]|jgi:pyruvate dehydrogenase E2 component (dihydrolipoamide acetyltransferase)|nr:2-oxo acid dehydrogenase subunit E2 [Clostridiales bacterium]